MLFADIVGFTPFAEALPPDEVVKLLDGLFTVFDDLCGQHGVEKIKTIGDAYMAVAGVPRPDPDHAVAIAELALDMQAATASSPSTGPGRWPCASASARVRSSPVSSDIASSPTTCGATR